MDMIPDAAWSTMPSLLGGVIVGASAVALLALEGRIAGVSGIFGGLLAPRRGDVAWRLCFVAGLVVGGLGLGSLLAEPFRGVSATPPVGMAVAGWLVGFGASLGNGCTSGHGVCGIGRRSFRSLVATVTFMVSGALTVFVIRHLISGWPS